MYALAIYEGSTLLYEKVLNGQKAFSIGRNRQNDVYLPDLTSAVSRYHAGIYCDGEGNYFLQDLGSRNGTYVNGKRRDYGRLIEGEQIEIGKYVLRFKSQSDAPERKKKLLTLVEPNSKDAHETVFSPIKIKNDEYDSIKDNVEMLQVLYLMSHIYNSTRDLDRTLIHVVDELRSLFRPERILIALLENNGGRLVDLASYPIAKGELQFSRTILHHLLSEQNILVTENALDDVRFRQSTKAPKSIQKLQIKAAICVPLYVEGKIKAILYMDGYEAKTMKRKEELCFLSILGSELSLIIERYFQSQQEHLERIRLQNRFFATNSLVGISIRTRELSEAIEKYANVDATVVILGETGTGKNLVAGLLHQHSDRHKGAFIEINCSAVPENLLESEMFGVIANYPGMQNPKALTGKFELADNGTLFLNEIGDLPLYHQPKLLEALDSKRIWPLGAKEPKEVNIRIVVATNHDLESDVRNGKFRQDLYERLNIIQIQVPPLRERKEDIMVLAGFFLYQLRQDYNKTINRFSGECVDFLQAYDWPGNVRQLRHAIERAVLTTETSLITPNHFDIHKNENLPISLRDAEKEHIIGVLRYTKGNKEQASRILGISKQTLYNKGKEYDLPGFIVDDQTV